MWDPTALPTDDPTQEALPDLCHKCGHCCRSATTAATHPQLQAMAEAGNASAQEFLDNFIPYPSLEAAQAAEPEAVGRILKELSTREDFNADTLTIYRCPHVTTDGLCSIHDRRPSCCRRAPVHGWMVMPPNCGYDGWQFEQRERMKFEIRQLKTMLHWRKALNPEADHREAEARVEAALAPWKRFGADQW